MIRKGFPPNKCRLCGFNKSQGQDVYSASAKREGLLSKITKYLSKQVIHIVVGDGLPKFICIDCQGVINKFTDFCDMVQDVQKRLEEEKLDFSQVLDWQTHGKTEKNHENTEMIISCPRLELGTS